ncbi:MAG: hypothetical protein MK212_03340 [Saprospiraceae bacterium]|nr:hypothetical protein [Saprospiraceae bacterium]
MATNEYIPSDIPKQPIQKKPKYSLLNYTLAFLACAGMALLIGYLQKTDILTKGNIAVLLMSPILVGITLAACNYKHLNWLAFLGVPLLFTVAIALPIIGIVFISQTFELDMGDSILGDGLLLVVLPFIGGSTLYRGYAQLAGRASILMYLLQVLLSITCFFIMSNNSMNISIDLLQCLFFGGSAAILSTLHFEKLK